MRIFNRLSFLLLIVAGTVCTFSRIASYSFAEDYESAGVIPLFKTKINAHCILYLQKNFHNVPLVADKYIIRDCLLDTDSADTAARAFFKRQCKYDAEGDLANALRRGATKIYSGKHIIYLFEFDVNDLLDVTFSSNWRGAPYDNLHSAMESSETNSMMALAESRAVIIDAGDLKEALHYGWQLRCAKRSVRGIQVHDAFGTHGWTLLDDFLIGLTDNYLKIRHLFV